MYLAAVVNILVGSTLGLILRLFIKNYLKKKKAFYLSHALLVNVLSSLLLGMYIGLNPTNKHFLLFFSTGFLGCFSTFSSYIYELFNLMQKRKYVSLIIYYIEVLVLTFLFFCLGIFTILMLKN